MRTKLQGMYYLATGLWPIINITSFEKATGRKTDKWLVKTIGLQTAVIGLSLLAPARSKKWSPQRHILSLGSALGFTLADLLYAARSQKHPAYLADAIIEMYFLKKYL